MKNKIFKLGLSLSIFILAGFFVGAKEVIAVNQPNYLWHFNECSGLSVADFVSGDNFNTGGNVWDIGKWNCGLKQYYKYSAAQANFSQPISGNNLTFNFYYKFLDNGSRLYFRLANGSGQQIKIIPAPSYTEIYGLPTSFGARLNKGWPADNEWHQLALTINASLGQWILYLDGNEFYNYSGDSFNLPEFNYLEIKGDSNYNWIDEVALWPNILTSAEIQSIYQANMELGPQAPIIPADDKKMLNLWQFDEGQGSVIADTIGQTTLPQNASWTEGKWGSGLYQSWQTGQRINADLNQTINVHDLTLEFWWKNHNFPNEARGRFYLEGSSGQFGIIPSKVRTTLITPYGNTVLEPSPLANFDDANWHHLALVFNSSNYSLDFYIDAQKVYTQKLIPLNLALSSIHFYGENWPYSLDEFTIWQGALSQQDITDYYNSGQPHKKSGLDPVILVPGIMGSYLYSSLDPGVEVWPAVIKTVIDPWDFHLNQLIMDNEGKPTANTMIVPPQDIVRSVLNKDFFAGLIDELKQNGYEENKNLFVFPYDWRLDLNWSANGIPYSSFDSLKDKIEKIKLQTGAQKVNIIAHSMGGLVAKNYIKHYGSDSVNKFIDIGTPHLGAPEALKILMYGDDLDFNYLGIGLNSERIKLISQNFPSVYQLLPSRNYFNNADQNYAYYIYDMHDLDNNDTTGRLNYDQTVDFIKNTGRNNYLLGFNEALHSDLDNYSPRADGIKTYNIIGCGEPTIGQIFVLNKEKSGKYEYGLKYISGDGTVPLKSAEALTADDSYYIKGAEHSVLSSADGIKQIVTAALKDTIGSFSLQNYPMISRSSINCSLTGTQVSFHSPIDLNIYDENNNHVGPNENGDIELGIVGAQYDNLDGNKFVFLPAGHNYKVVGQATDSGTFNARIQNIENGQYMQTVYYNEVPLESSSTVAQMQINDGQLNGAMEIDQNGDQIFETQVEPSAVLNQEEAMDLIKPEIQIEISGTAGNGSYYISTTTVALMAADNQGGSGILKMEYSLDNGLTWQEYNSPIVLNNSGEYNILYKSIDRAGNIEEEKEQRLKIDTAVPLINILIPLENQDFWRDEFLTAEYKISDDYSGVASSSIMAHVDNQPINQWPLDLFDYNLGEHILKLEAIDQAGNKAEASVKFIVNTDLDSAISDVNRSYDLGWIKNKTVKSWLNEELNEIKKYEEKFGERQNKLEQKQEKVISQCLKKRNKTWCEKRLKNYNKVVYKLNQVHEKIITKRFQEILKKLDDYYKKQWLNRSAYDIIKEDVNYLINNL
ncbi:MAG: alpha/beta fold hydrolase [Patescibacteria group bacterium]